MVNGQMPIPSKRFDVWRRLYRRFTLEPEPSVGESRAGVGTTILPVTQADELLRTQKLTQAAALDLSTGGSYTAILTAGDQERIILISVWIEATTAATHIQFQPGGTAFDFDADATAARNVDLQRLTLEPGESVGLRGTGNAGDSARAANVYYLTEDIF